MDDLIDIEFPPQESSSIIKVIGVGGGGSNAVNYMYNLGIKDVDFVICNTDAKALASSPICTKIQLGVTLTEGLGAGNDPQRGRDAAIENIQDVRRVLENRTKMVFITAGMGGGTGTGAAPIIASAAKEMGILTVGIVTLPLRREGYKRVNQAIEGILEMEKHVDSLLLINNERLRDLFGDLPLSQAFAKADNVLAIAAKGIAEIITIPGYVNIDFADVETVMKNSGVSIMGSGIASGEFRAQEALQSALESPLLNFNSIDGAKDILINFSSGQEQELKMGELDYVIDHLQNIVGNSASIIWGMNINKNFTDELNITIVATGFSSDHVITNDDDDPKNHKKRYVLDSEGNVMETDNDSFIIEKNQTSSNDYKEESPRRVMVFDNENKENDLNINKFYGSSEDKRHAEKKVEPLLDVETATIGYAVQPIRKINPKDLSNEKLLEKIESEPAYKRRGMLLNKDNADLQPQNKPFVNPENRISRFTISDSGTGPVITKENTYLHGNPC
ncbi:MAG: cell division protein FtsZ [Marinilabiliaceae bacterium]|nr:cell division protein FtsZ [Marinilabiliaceae bacterium]